jgi:predicted transcriptional regulator
MSSRRKIPSTTVPMPTSEVLHVTVGETLAQAAQRTARTMQALQDGQPAAPYFGISFGEIGQLLGVFTPRRWELIAALRETGPLTIAALARRLGRNYKNVHSDVVQLMEWMAVERGEDGQVNVPWAEIVVDMKLPQRQAA